MPDPEEVKPKPRRKSASPTQLVLAALRKDGWLCAIVERWNQHAMIRQDLMGWCDLLAVRPGETLGVQASTADHAAERRAKVAAEPRAHVCVAAGWRVEVWGVDTRRPTAPLCEECHGVGKVSARTGLDDNGDATFGPFARCRTCRGTGRAKRPRTMRRVILRWRMGDDGSWRQLDGHERKEVTP